MESGAETVVSPSSSNLAQLLTNNSLTFEQLLSTPGIDSLIRSDIKTFVHYCKEREAFATKFIRWGIIGPEQPSDEQKTLNMVFVCNSILTSQHEALSGLFIHTSREDESSSSEEEENGKRSSQQRTVIAADYVYLGYLLGLIEEAMQEESYLDYLAKVLRTIASVKLPFLLAYLSDQIELYHKIVRLAHFPSVGNLLAQMLTGQNRLPMKAARMREMMIPSLLAHIHQNLAKQEIYLAYECFDEVIGTLGRSEDGDEDQLQEMCNKIVCSSEIMFYVGSIERKLNKEVKTEIDLIQLKNCIEYLILVVKKMRQDERKDNQNSSAIFKPTLDYQTTQLYQSFFKLLTSSSKIYNFQNIGSVYYKIVHLRYFQLLLIMSKHSTYTEHYQKYTILEKQEGVCQLILFILNKQNKGIILQMAVNLLEQILLQEERLFIYYQINNQSLQPEVLLSFFDRQKDFLVGRVDKMLSSSQIYSNINENEVQIRKMLIIVNNYLEKYRNKWNDKEHEHLTKIVPSFNSQICEQYLQKLVVQDHPLGNRVKPIDQFQFAFRTKQIQQVVIINDKPKQLKTVVFKLQRKIKTHKQKVREKNIVKDQENDEKQQNTETESTKSQKQMNIHQDKVSKDQNDGQKIEQVESASNPEANTYLPIY